MGIHIIGWLLELFNNGVIIAWLYWTFNNKNGNSWYKATLPISFTKCPTIVGNSSWWGACFNPRHNESNVTELYYMVWDYRNNTTSNGLQTICIGY